MNFSRLSKKDLIKQLEHLTRVQTFLLEENERLKNFTGHALEKSEPEGVRLRSYGNQKLKAIKLIRYYTTFQLKEAKNLVENQLPHTFCKDDMVCGTLKEFFRDLIESGFDVELIN
jgi:ribosomal protein L7/L12